MAWYGMVWYGAASTFFGGFIDLPLSFSAGAVSTYVAALSSHLNNAFFHYLPASPFPFSLCFGRAIFFQFLLCCGPFLVVPCTSILSSSIYCCMAVPHTLHSTAQSTRTKPQTRHVPIGVQAGRQSWRERAYRPFIQHAEFSKRTKKSKSVRPTRMYNHTQRWCNARKTSLQCKSQ